MLIIIFFFFLCLIIICLLFWIICLLISLNSNIKSYSCSEVSNDSTYDDKPIPKNNKIPVPHNPKIKCKTKTKTKNNLHDIPPLDNSDYNEYLSSDDEELTNKYIKIKRKKDKNKASIML